MKYLIIVAIVLLSGCSKTISQNGLEAANNYCDGRDGIFSIETNGGHSVWWVTCRNGDRAHEKSAEINSNQDNRG